MPRPHRVTGVVDPLRRKVVQDRDGCKPAVARSDPAHRSGADVEWPTFMFNPIKHVEPIYIAFRRWRDRFVVRTLGRRCNTTEV
jgi:hypothetical protein